MELAGTSASPVCWYSSNQTIILAGRKCVFTDDPLSYWRILCTGQPEKDAYQCPQRLEFTFTVFACIFIAPLYQQQRYFRKLGNGDDPYGGLSCLHLFVFHPPYLSQPGFLAECGLCACLSVCGTGLELDKN